MLILTTSLIDNRDNMSCRMSYNKHEQPIISHINSVILLLVKVLIQPSRSRLINKAWWSLQRVEGEAPVPPSISLYWKHHSCLLDCL